MKILHTITCTKFQPAFNAHEQFTRHLTRRHKLTYRGVQRMFSRGCEEYPADTGVSVTRIETAVFAR